MRNRSCRNRICWSTYRCIFRWSRHNVSCLL